MLHLAAIKVSRSRIFTLQLSFHHLLIQKPFHILKFSLSASFSAGQKLNCAENGLNKYNFSPRALLLDGIFLVCFMPLGHNPAPIPPGWWMVIHGLTVFPLDLFGSRERPKIIFWSGPAAWVTWRSSLCLFITLCPLLYIKMWYQKDPDMSPSTQAITYPW